MQERRKTIRREADERLLERAKRLQKMVDRRSHFEGEDAARKLRHAIRHNCKASLRMVIGHVSGGSDTWKQDAVTLEGRVLDLSEEGASLFAKQAFEAGQEFRLAIEMKNGSKVETNAVVRWVKAIPEKKAYAAGVQFVRLAAKDQEKIHEFLQFLDANVGL